LRLLLSRSGLTKVQAAVIVAIIVIAIIAGGWYYWQATKPPEKVTIIMQVDSDPEAESNQVVVDYWNEHYAEMTGIEVRLETVSFQGYFDRLTSQLVSDSPTPDIVHPWSYYTGQYAPYVEPLDDYIANPKLFSSPKGEPYNIKDKPESVLAAGRADGKIYFFSHSGGFLALIYRTDAISKPPATWEEFLELARQNTKSVNPDSKTTYGAAVCGLGPIDTTSWKTWLAVYWSYGGNYFQEGTMVPDFESEAALKALGLWDTLVKEKLMPPDVTGWAFLETMAAFQSGEVAMILDWNPVIGTLRDSKESPKVYDKVAMTLPPVVAYTGHNMMGIKKTSQHKEQAFKFLAWLLFGEGVDIEVEVYQGTLSNARLYTNPEYLEKYPWVKEAAELKWEVKSRAEPNYKEMPTVQSIGAGVINSLLSGTLTPEQAAAKLQQDIYAELEKAGYYA